MRPFFVEMLGTPEAGKTSSIRSVINSLTYQGYSVSYIQEAAEVVPAQFSKKSIEGHLWIRLHVLQSILEKIYLPTQIILCDRGILDAMFWNQLYFEKGLMAESELKSFNEFIHAFHFMPQYAIVLTTTPEEALKRRGGKGRIVTYDFLCNFNQKLTSFCDSISVPHFVLDTTGMSKDDVAKVIETNILNIFNQ